MAYVGFFNSLLSLAASLSDADRVLGFTSQGRSIKVYDGEGTGYPANNYPTPRYPATASEADRDVMRVPLLSIALSGDTLFVTDALGGRILKYHKISGNHLGTIDNIPLACGLAIAPDGNVWVGHEHAKVSVYSPTGERLATPVTDLAEVRALAIQGSTLAVADRTGSVRKYSINGTQATLLGSYGLPQRPGDRAPQRLSAINGLAMNSAQAIFVSDRLGDGSRLQMIDASLGPVWQQMDLEFSSSGTYASADPSLVFSAHRKAYRVDKATGQWSLLGTARTEFSKGYFGNYDSTHFGPPNVVRFGARDFLYFPAGDSLAIYSIEPAADAERGPTLKLCSVLGGSQPGPDGLHRDETWRTENRYLWEWNDTQGDGEIQFSPGTGIGRRGEVDVIGLPGNPHPDWAWVRRAVEVDDAGWVWMTSANRNHIPKADDPFEAEALYAIAPRELNVLGYPVYRWSDAVRVADDAAGRAALGLTAAERLEWKSVGRSDDGMVYALAWSNKAGLPQDDSAWMGGNVLFGFGPFTGTAPTVLGAPKWRVTLPKRSVGMVPIPGGRGGALVGIDPGSGTVGHFMKDGLLIGSMQAAARFRDSAREPWVVGALDANLAVNCKRDPQDGLLDVFVEDNLNGRIMWYRVDDTNIQVAGEGVLGKSTGGGALNVLTVNGGIGGGNYAAGTAVQVAAATPPPNKEFAFWTGDTFGLGDTHSRQTTLIMSNIPVTVTAVYRWAITTTPKVLIPW